MLVLDRKKPFKSGRDLLEIHHGYILLKKPYLISHMNKRFITEVTTWK